MIFALVTNETGLNAMAGLATLLCIFGLLVVWAQWHTKRNPKENEDNRGNLK